MIMNIHQVVFFVFLSALCAGNIRPVTARLKIYTGATGGRGFLIGRFSKRDDRKFFCKDDCKGENILVETVADVAANGRYSVQYKEESSEEAQKLASTLTVAITDLKKSDSGRYRGGLGDIASPHASWDFQLRVIDAPVHGNSRFARTDVEGETVTYGCNKGPVSGGWKFLCKDKCVKEEDILIETTDDVAQNGRFSLRYMKYSLHGMEVTFSNVTRSDTGWYRCGYGRALTSVSHKTFPLLVIADTVSDPSSTESPPPTTEKTPPDVLVYVLVVFVIIIVVLGLALILVFIHRKIRPLGLNRRGQRDDMNMKVPSYENDTPASGIEEPVYESLDPATREQFYSTLGYRHHDTAGSRP